MTSQWTIRIQDHPDWVGERADKALLEILKADHAELTRSQLQRWFEEDLVRMNGQPLKGSHKLHSEDVIDVERPAIRILDLKPKNLPLTRLYEDPDLVVVNKPPELSVHPSTTKTDDTLVHALLHHISDLSTIGGTVRPGIVHRIDEDTSGALVIAKNDLAHQALSAIFAAHDLDREYWALVYGAPERNQTIDTLIGRNPTDRKKMSADVKSGKRAITHIQVAETYALPGKKPFASLIRARLETGRTHQIRVHLTKLGHSLLGDPVYGTPTSKNAKWTSLPSEVQKAVEALPGQALHAESLGFKHPRRDLVVLTHALPPSGFSALLSELRKYKL